MISIWSLIFVSEPYFNEPGFESTMGTAGGDMESMKYNEGLHRGVWNFAILAQIVSLNHVDDSSVDTHEEGSAPPTKRPK